jgi:hypothetical protein
MLDSEVHIPLSVAAQWQFALKIDRIMKRPIHQSVRGLVGPALPQCLLAASATKTSGSAFACWTTAATYSMASIDSMSLKSIVEPSSRLRRRGTGRHGCCDMVASNRFSALVAVAAKKAVT